jgi:DNA-3-methyladenine glycosylase II
MALALSTRRPQERGSKPLLAARRIDIAGALEHLRGAHPGFAGLVKTAPACPFRRKTDYFPALCRAILAQQISSAAARTVTAKFRGLFARNKPTPEGLLALSAETLRSAGIGPQRQTYLRALAQAHVDGTLPRVGWQRLSDEEVVAALTLVKGIGKWTAEMFLIFVLARPNVWPVDDLGIQYGAMHVLGMKKRPTKGQLERLGRKLEPHRSVASWYLWRASEMRKKG